MPVIQPKKPIKPKRSRRVIILLLMIILFAGVVFWLNSRRAEAPDPSTVQTEQTAQKTDSEPPYEAPDLQPAVQEWADEQNATYSIVVYDLQAQEIIASILPDKEYFAASLYKSYVAYLALLDMQEGRMDSDEILWSDVTRKECVDKMIRESHSPCGEAMMADIGQTTLNQRVEALGMTGTYFNGIRTTAGDSALIMRFIAEGRHLNEANSAFLRDALLTQEARFKRGLATGAPEAKWETKVGWNEDINYHDTGILTLPDDREFAVAILGQGSGASAPIADFAKTIYDALTQ